MSRMAGASRRRSWRRAVLALLALLAAGPASAAEVRLPLTVDWPGLRTAFRRHLHDVGGEVWASADRCSTLRLREPTIEPAGGRLRIGGRASVRAGVGLAGWCWVNVEWEGHADVLATPELTSGWQLRLRDLDPRLTDLRGRPSPAGQRILDAVQAWAAEDVSTFALDLGPPAAELRGVLRGFVEPDPAGPWLAAIDSIRPAGVSVEEDGIRVLLALDLPAAPAAAGPAAPEAALSPNELRRWQARLEHWDAFLVFVIKDLGIGDADPAVRQELLDLLLEARQELLAVLARGPEGRADPVRALFLQSWDRLRGLVRRAATRQQDEARALRYGTFLAAADALAAVEVAAPAAGFELSADGLRRLARLLDPAHGGDPLEYSDLPDATLRQIFRFRDPDAPPRRPRRRAPSGWLWPGPRAAHAQDAGDEWTRLARRLDRWVPDRGELGAYRQTVERLLTLAAERTIDPDELDERFDELFHHLVHATAWQESCWRQFVRRDGAVTYIASSTGDVGIMQINVRIWRGFFSPDKLRWSATYNAGAGAEILFQLLLRYGAREARERLDNGARATYAAYNGGPARYRRYRQARTVADRAFWEKYQAVAAGRAGDRVLCLAGS